MIHIPPSPSILSIQFKLRNSLPLVLPQETQSLVLIQHIPRVYDLPDLPGILSENHLQERLEHIQQILDIFLCEALLLLNELEEQVPHPLDEHLLKHFLLLLDG